MESGEAYGSTPVSVAVLSTDFKLAPEIPLLPAQMKFTLIAENSVVSEEKNCQSSPSSWRFSQAFISLKPRLLRVLKTKTKVLNLI